MNQRLALAEAIQPLKRDPTHPVRVKVDEELTVEVRAVEVQATLEKTLGELLREIGTWECGERSGAGRALHPATRKPPGS